MASYLPYQVPYQNQLQFNLGVPLMTQNIASSFHHPSPILVERVGGQHAIPSKIPNQKLQGSPKPANVSAANYSTLSEDKMEVMSQLARRDLKNRALQAQMANSNTSTTSSPLRGRSNQTQAHGKARNIQCHRLRPQRQGRPPLTAKEAEKNRRFGAVQTPPPHRAGSHTRLANDSVLSQKNITSNTTQESDIYFPVKPTLPSEAHNSDEIAKLQQEMEGYLSLVERILNRAIDEGSTDFLRPPTRGKQRAGYLQEEEGYERARARVGEQNTRSVRNLYNLRQKVKQLQRDVTQADLGKPAKKNQVMIQLVVVYRGAGKAVQTFVNQLPYQDLGEGLPQHFHELTLLLKQLAGLASLTRLGKPGAGQEHGGLLTLLESIEALNAKWCAQLKGSELHLAEKPRKKPVVSKGWVSNTKVDKDIFATKDKLASVAAPSIQPKRSGPAQHSAPKRQQHKPRPQQRGLRQARFPQGKENRRDFNFIGRREELRAGISALLQHQEEGRDLDADKPTGVPPRPVAWEIEVNKKPHKQDHRKGYMLPSDLIEKRERAQRAVEASNQKDWSFADPTVSSRLKTSLRPSSAPPSPDKHVNFDLDRQSPVPWIPVGSSPSRTSHSPRSRSLSSERGSPFFVRDLDSQDVRKVLPEQQRFKNSRKVESGEIPRFGFQSLPTDKKLRSADVSNSFIDAVEHRLLARMMGQQARDGSRGGGGHQPMMEYRPSSVLDLTGDTTGDLFSEAGDDTLNTTCPEQFVQREAVSLLDAPTLENVKLRLRQMQLEQREIRQRWSSLKFYDPTEKSKIFSASEILSDRPRDPPAIQLGRHDGREQRQNITNRPVSKEIVEVPLIFTKPSASTRSIQYLHSVRPDATGEAGRNSPLTLASLHQPAKRLLSLKQTTAERIAADRARFESYLKRRSHHPSGKFDPWALMDEISEEILMDCLKDVAEEVEVINEDIANHMYKSEFLVDHSKSPLTESQQRLHRFSGGDDRSAAVTSPKNFESGGQAWKGGSPKHSPTSQGDQSPSYAGQRGGQADQRPATPRSPLRYGSPRRGASPPGVAAGHLWRSQPNSPTGSAGQGAGSRSPTPRSPQVSISAGERAMVRSPTTRGQAGAARSPLREGRASPGGRRSPQVSASEPLLEDVSHLLPHKHSSDEEQSQGSEDTRVDEGKRKTDYNGEDDDDDDDDEDDDEDYSEEDFEDVTDVEL